MQTQTTPELWQYLVVFFENSPANNHKCTLKQFQSLQITTPLLAVSRYCYTPSQTFWAGVLVWATRKVYSYRRKKSKQSTLSLSGIHSLNPLTLENLYLKMLSVYVVCWIFLQTFQTYFCIQANSVDPDQTAPRGAVWSGSTLFAKMTFKITSRWQSRWQLLWLAVYGLRLNKLLHTIYWKSILDFGFIRLYDVDIP